MTHGRRTEQPRERLLSGFVEVLLTALNAGCESPALSV